MKNLTYKQLLEAPAKIRFIYNMAMAKQPVTTKILEEAIADHPQYFPDELEHREKVEKIPEYVHYQYLAEREKIIEDCYKEIPQSKGILGLINDPNGYQEWSVAYEKCRKAEKKLVAALHKKYYNQYGIESNQW